LTAVSFCTASHDPLDLAVQAFNNLNLSTVRADQTAAAAIRIAAMELFAERGYAEVTVRQIASAAGVSPALVIHHYGSKDKLRAVLEELWVPRTSSSSRDQAILVDQTTDASLSSDAVLLKIGRFGQRFQRRRAVQKRWGRCWL